MSKDETIGLEETVENNPVKELLEGAYFYEDTSVGSTRKEKYCDLCGNNIPKGSSHIGAKIFRDEYYQVDFCKKCEKKYSKELNEMRNHDYDDY